MTDAAARKRRIRRVKCDETRPNCQRCEKFGRQCDGYEPAKSSPKARHTNGRPLNPNPSTLAAAICPSRVEMTVQCSDAREEEYLRFFWTETAGTLSGGFDNRLWSEIVLQACNDEPCIFHSAIALAALDKSSRARRLHSSTITSEEHHDYAIRRYDVAIRAFREVLQFRKDSLRTVLIAALLVFCFESFYGDLRQALNNVQRAVELLYQWLSKFERAPATPHFSPAPDIIEDEIVSAFTRMNAHFLSWIDAPTPTTATLLSLAPAEAHRMPEAFGSLVEAKAAFDHVTNHVLMFLGGIQPIDTKSMKSESSSSNPELTLAQQPAVLAELRQWGKTFESVLNRARMQNRAQDFVGATIIRIHAVTVDICLRSAHFKYTKPHAYDVFLPDFCELVGLCQSLIAHPGLAKSFVYNVGFIPSLFVVVTKCTDAIVRQEAIDVLKASSPRREGAWDALMVARIGEELIRSEAEELRTGQIKEKIGIRLACMSMPFDLPRPPRTLEDIELKRVRHGSLLDWAERSIEVSAAFGTLNIPDASL